MLSYTKRISSKHTKTLQDNILHFTPFLIIYKREQSDRLPVSPKGGLKGSLKYTANNQTTQTIRKPSATLQNSKSKPK